MENKNNRVVKQQFFSLYEKEKSKIISESQENLSFSTTDSSKKQTGSDNINSNSGKKQKKSVENLPINDTYHKNINNNINNIIIKSKSVGNIHNKNRNLFKNLEKIKSKNKNESYFRKIYSNEFIEFQNEITKMPHYIKKYKEDDISFTKTKVLPEIKWQDYDNDVLTSEEQKKSAIKREINWIGETIKRIQNNEKYFTFNVTMYKLSQKYPNKKIDIQ